MKKVSIIIPAYNAEKYICECLNSVLQVDYENKEILVIDDGSTDLTGRICEEYACKYNEIKVWHKKNGGVSSARNMGLNKAKGEYIFFVDSDDVVEMDYVSKLMIKGNEDFVQGGCGLISNDFLREVMSKEDILQDYARYWFESPCTFVWRNCYKKKIIDDNQLRFDENVKLGEDGRFNNNYLIACKSIRRTLESPYKYNCVETSAVHKLYLDRLEIEKEECLQIENYAKNKESMLRLRWYHWHLVLEHYQTHMIKTKELEKKNSIKIKMKEAYREPYFRETLAYIRKKGSVDEKIEAILMGNVRHILYKPAMNFIKLMYNAKNY